MVDLEELVEILSPFFRHMQRMESELKCCKCLNLLRCPRLLPCVHIICRECISVKDEDAYSCCPVCESRFLYRDAKPAVHMKNMVDIFREMDDDIVGIIQQSRKYNDTLTRQCKSPSATPFLAESTKISPMDDSCEKVEVDATEEVTLHSKDPSTTKVQNSRIASNVGKKHGILESNDGVQGSKRPKLHGKQNDKKRLQTPIGIFDDECAFCHSFRTSQFHGPMACYLNERLVAADKGNRLGVIYVHKKCLEWAPRVYFKGETILNLKSEIARASRLKCSRCAVPGAALGCYYEKCKKSFHVPCAVQTPECRWDVENGYLLCPEHVSQWLPCDKSESMNKGNNGFPLNKSHFSGKPEVKIMTDEQSDQHNTSGDHKSEWMLLGPALSPSEKDLLEQFATLVSATLAERWTTNVTHVIVTESDAGAWSRTYETLMAILSGKWVVTVEWIRDSLKEGHPVPEISYEVKISHDIYGSLDGPKKGRTRAAEGAPKLFAGLSFCVSAYLNPHERDHLEDLIAAAEGKILKDNILQSQGSSSNEFPRKTYFIYNAGAPAACSTESLLELKKEFSEGVGYAVSGVHVISHMMVFNAIAAYDVQFLTRRNGKNLDMFL